MQLSPGLVALAALLTKSVHGHMIMKNPVPYGKSTLNNSPLQADGSDFPCKQRPGVYDPEGAHNILEIGKPNELSFIGGATHNGGSCQVSLTTDLEPTKDSRWMVIKSIEGGCPAPAAMGNCGTSASDSCASSFQYTIPEGFVPGKYTIAWSWINHTGNREFFMNCGPAEIFGAKKKRHNPTPIGRRQAHFPDMFVANIPSINDCTTIPEGVDYAYPDPGQDVERAGQPGALFTLSCGASNHNATQQTTVATTPAGGRSPGFGDGADVASAFVSGGVFATISVTNVQTGESSTLASSAAKPAATGSAFSSGSETNPSSDSSSSSSCTVGDWNCIDGRSYKRCVGTGTWSSTVALSTGMICQPGISSILKWSPGKSKRVVRVAEGLFDGYNN